VKTVAALLLAVGAPALACDGLEVSGAWIREAPPGSDVMAAYAQLHNAGKDSITLDGARSSDFGDVQVHRTSMENGKMRMRAEPRILLEPDATVSFEPGGLHLMLFGPKRALKAGDHVTLKLDCGKQSKAVDFTVRAGE
jgi:copper(I)-binding protein